MTDGDALLRAVIENVADDAPRLVYADWLEEHGEPERAEFIRLQCELGQWERVYDRESGDRLVHPDGRERRPDDSEWTRLLEREHELAEQNWQIWLWPLLRQFGASARSPGDAPRRYGFLRRLTPRTAPFELVYDPRHAPLQSCRVRRPGTVLDNESPLIELSLERGFAGVIHLGSRVGSKRFEYLLAEHPVEILWLRRPPAEVVAIGFRGRRVRLRNLVLDEADSGALQIVLGNRFDVSSRQLTIMNRTCPHHLPQLLAECSWVAKLEVLGIVFSGFDNSLTWADARALARNSHFRHIPRASLTIMGLPAPNEPMRILTERFGLPEQAGLSFTFHLGSPESVSAGPPQPASRLV